MRNLLLALAVFSGTAISAKQEKFSDLAWKKITPIYATIVKHPFNQELADGVLRKDRFKYYLDQDRLYLVAFSKSLAILASKLDNPVEIENVIRFAQESLGEHQPGANATRLMMPANFSYTNFLLSTAAFKSREELAAALLPCFWIYAVLARQMREKASTDNPYYHWIKTYSSEKYQRDVDIMIAVVNRLARDTTAEHRVRMLEAFTLSSRLEWYFWEDSYWMRNWEPGLVSLK